MRLLRTLAPLAMVAVLAAACGSGSSSDTGSGPTSTGTSSVTSSSDQLEVRPVFARYTPGVVQFGPAVPTDLKDRMTHQACPMKPAVVQDMLMECDADKTVYLMKDPISTGGIESAVAKQIGHGKEWFIEVTMDPDTAAKLKAGTAGLKGTDIAYSFQGMVLTAVIVDSSFTGNKLAIIGNYDKASATQLATELNKA